jgi:protoporphyrinogen oxidase
MQQQNWGIIGGGIMGMTLALRLAQEGHKVTLFEAAADFGGLASAWKIDNFIWDKFYHVILLSDLKTRNLLKEIDLEQKINWVETKTGFYTGGQLYSMSNTLEFLAFPPLNIIDKFRLGLTIFVASKIRNWKRLEQIPVTTWLKKWSGNRTFNKIWLPLLRAKLGDNYQKTSAAFIWTTIHRMYAARRSGLKKEMFGYVSGGYAAIIHALKSKLESEGVELKTEHEVIEIKSDIDQKPVACFKNSYAESFDHLIVTLPPSVAANVCNGLSAEEINRFKKIEYMGIICVSIVLNDSISPFYVTNITDTWVPFTGIIEMSALVDKKYFDGKALIYLPKYLSPNDRLFDASEEEIKKMFLSALKQMYPKISDSDIKFVGIARARSVLALPTIKYSMQLPSVRTSIPGVYLLNTAHITDGTLNVNETIRIAETKLTELLNNTSL